MTSLHLHPELVGTSDLDPTTVTLPLRLAVSRALGTVVVTLHGGLDAAGAKRLGHALVDLIEDQGNRSVLLDLRHVDVLDEAAVGVLGMACAIARRRGAELVLSGPSDRLYRCLDALGVADAVVSGDAGRRLHPAGSARIHQPQGGHDDSM